MSFETGLFIIERASLRTLFGPLELWMTSLGGERDGIGRVFFQSCGTCLKSTGSFNKTLSKGDVKE